MAHPFFDVPISVRSAAVQHEAALPSSDNNESDKTILQPNHNFSPNQGFKVFPLRTTQTIRKKSLWESGKVDLRNILTNELSRGSGAAQPSVDSRRVVSDPTHRLSRFLSPVERPAALSFAQDGHHAVTHTPLDNVFLNPSAPRRRELARRTSSESFFTTDTDVDPPILKPTDSTTTTAAKESKISVHLPEARPKPSSQKENITPPLNPLSHISVGSTRPIAFNTALLVPKTHKTTHGTLTILPSGSILVDFRESQRKVRQRGNEVMIINGNGDKVR